VVHHTDDYAWLIYRDGGSGKAKQIPQQGPHLELAPSQSDPELDNLPPVRLVGQDYVVTDNRKAVQEAIGYFFNHFPKGFRDEKYHSHERNYKDDASKLLASTLGGGGLRALLAEGNIDQIRAHVTQILRASINLIEPRFEKRAFLDSLGNDEAATRYFSQLASLLESLPEDEERAYSAYINACSQLPQMGQTRVFSWPVVTLLPALADPFRFMFVKPRFIKTAQDWIAFDLKYSSKPNWTTYDAVRKMASLYFGKIEALRPTDLMDVYTFIFVVGGGYDAKPEEADEE